MTPYIAERAARLGMPNARDDANATTKPVETGKLTREEACVGTADKRGKEQ